MGWEAWKEIREKGDLGAKNIEEPQFTFLVAPPPVTVAYTFTNGVSESQTK